MNERERLTTELTFEEEAKYYEAEARAEFAKETGNGDSAGVNNILRRGMRIIKKARKKIANGVTVREWIPVTERLPNRKKVIDGETYFKNVAVRVKDCGFEKIAYYDDEEKYWFDTNSFPVVGEVTYWCELPEWDLPEPPKGE